ncbi:MAG: helix-turn-helix transcriptional regulator [Burkholderiaceae bacterium]|nr:helix-turn-helix transcriptional regulator [Burkholderiaceae bacterium]
MPAYSDTTSVLDRQLLLQLGERLKRLRKQQGLSSVAMAQRVGISRTTLSAVEAGDLAPSMGSYLRVMSALGVTGELALLASGTLHTQNEPPAKPSRRALPRVSVTVKASDGAHDVQDLQSLMLHKEAVRLIKRNPALQQKVLDNLERWRKAPNQHSRFLWDEWAVILHRGDWRRALSTSRRGQELRQASPLPTILPPEVRAEVLAQIGALKKGVVLGTGASAQAAVAPAHLQLEPKT